MVPGAGLEPAQCFHRGILSPLRLPISPPGHRWCRIKSKADFITIYSLRAMLKTVNYIKKMPTTFRMLAPVEKMLLNQLFVSPNLNHHLFDTQLRESQRSSFPYGYLPVHQAMGKHMWHLDKVVPVPIAERDG